MNKYNLNDPVLFNGGICFILDVELLNGNYKYHIEDKEGYRWTRINEKELQPYIEETPEDSISFDYKELYEKSLEIIENLKNQIECYEELILLKSVLNEK